MVSVQLPTQWLQDAWGGPGTQDMHPVMFVDGETLKVTIFPKGGAGMRVVTRRIPKTGQATFKVADDMRAYVHLLEDFPDVKLDVKDTTLTVTAETCCSAIQQHFQNIELAEDNIIPDDAQDVHLVVPAAQWLGLWKCTPQKGVIEVSCSKNRRSITVKHSKGRWAGAIHARDKSDVGKTFKCDALVTQRIFGYARASLTSSDLVFMHCGVLKWVHEHTTIYLAPLD